MGAFGITPKTPRLQLRDFDLGKRQIGKSGAFFVRFRISICPNCPGWTLVC